MTASDIKYAKLDQAHLEKLHALEKELGVYLLALEPEALKLADLSAEQLAKLQSAEDDLRVTLLAYEKTS